MKNNRLSKNKTIKNVLQKSLKILEESEMNGKISNFEQVASVRRYTLTGGREDGLEVLDCDNGKIRFLLNINKACVTII